jgi:hypothetical protein
MITPVGITNDHDLCAACGSVSPWAQIVLAEPNLALL